MVHFIIIINIIVILFSGSYSHQRYLMAFHWSLINRKSPQISRTLLSILVDLNNAVVWIVYAPHFISRSSRPFINPLMVVRRGIRINITMTFIFHCYFSSLASSKYLSFFSLSFGFTRWSAGTVKSTIWHFLFFLLSIWSFVGDYMIRLYLKIPEKFFHSGLYIYLEFILTNSNFLHNS